MPGEELEPKSHDSFFVSLVQDTGANTENITSITSSKRVHPNQKSKQLLRKLEMLRMRTQKLKERLAAINKRITTLKEQNRKKLETRARMLQMRLGLKRHNRENYLKSIRDKAKCFQRALSVDKSISTNSKFQNVNKEKVVVEEYYRHLHQIKFIQKRIRQYLMEYNISKLFATGFLQSYNKMTFSQCIKTVKENSFERKTISLIFGAFQLPDIFNNKYASFFYAFILICDYEDARRRNIHPGFNANSDDKANNLTNNFLWVLLYKISKQLISIFENLISNHSDLNTKEKFFSIYNQYCFVFKVFKKNHLNRIKLILEQSIDIASKQVEITNNLDIIKIKDNLLRENDLLKMYKICEVEIPIGIDENEWFGNLSSITAVGNNLIPQFNYRLSEEKMIFEHFTFTFPYNLDKYQWRKYFFLTYLKTLDREYVPSIMVTGRLNICRHSNLDIDEILSIVGESSNPNWFSQMLDFSEEKIIAGFFKVVNNDIKSLINYMHHFQDANQTLEERKILNYYEKSKNSNAKSLLQTKRDLQVLLSLLVEYLDINSLSSLLEALKECCCNLDKAEFLLADLIHTINNYYRYKRAIDNLWINKCKFSGFGDFKVFENVFIYSQNNSNLRSAFYTNSPCLKFPRFYDFLYRCNYSLDLQQYLTMFNGAISIPNIVNDHVNAKCYRYFHKIFIISILKGDFIMNEINPLFLDNFQNIYQNMNLVLDANTTMILLINFYSFFLPNILFSLSKTQSTFERIFTGYKKLLPLRKLIAGQLIPKGIYDEQVLSEFLTYHERSFPSIKQILLKKLIEWWNLDLPDMHHMVQKNFKYCFKEIEVVGDTLRKLLLYIYKLYGPTLNWIYKDIGEPI